MNSIYLEPVDDSVTGKIFPPTLGPTKYRKEGINGVSSLKLPHNANYRVAYANNHLHLILSRDRGRGIETC